MKKDKIIELLQQSIPYNEISKQLNCAKSTINHYAKQIGKAHPTIKRKVFDWNSIQQYYQDGHSKKECELYFNLPRFAWRDAMKMKKIVPIKKSIDNYLVYSKKKIYGLKRRLIESNIIKNECYECGIPNIWNGQILVLQLHHKNGDYLDNRLDNLKLVCPNCHSQTHNWGTKNFKFKDNLPKRGKKSRH